MDVVAVAVCGCAPTQPFFFFEDGDMSHYVGMATDIEHPDVETASLAEVELAGQPFTMTDPKYSEIWELSLQDAVRYALENSKVMRSLGGRQASFGGQRPQQDESPEFVLRAPQQTPTVYDPAIVESDPNFGVEGRCRRSMRSWAAACSGRRTIGRRTSELRDPDTNDDGDSRMRNDPNHRAILDVGFTRVRRQDLGQFNTTLSKRTGDRRPRRCRRQSIYEFSNSGRSASCPAIGIRTSKFQAQPAAVARGRHCSSIESPARFDPFNGAGSPELRWRLLARIRTDISLADFEAGVRNLVNDVEGAYWNLYFAYRNLEARKVGRDSALATWKRSMRLQIEGAKGGEADKEAQAREQYFFFRDEVETALSDLFRAENRLRYIMGLAATDGR